MNYSLKVEILKFLQEDVQELINGHDWLGTGSDMQWADREQQEWQSRLDYMIEKMKNSD